MCIIIQQASIIGFEMIQYSLSKFLHSPTDEYFIKIDIKSKFSNLFIILNILITAF